MHLLWKEGELIDALSLSFKAPVRQEQKSTTPVSGQSNEHSAFSMVFQTVSSGRQKAEGENQLREMLVKIEEALKVLQELPKETLSSEEMEILAGMLQMFAQQISSIKGGRENQQPGSVSQQTEKLPKWLSAISFEQDVPFMGADEKKLSMPLSEYEGADNVMAFEELEQAKSVIALVKELEQQAGKPFQGVSSQRLLQQLNSLLQEMPHPAEQAEIDQEPLEIESSLPLTGGQKTSGNILDQAPPQPGNGGNPSEPLPGQTNSAPLTGMALNGVQEGPAAPKAESSQQTSAVRFSHLIEDLGEVFRGTIRLQSSSEAAQMRVNIFPEHLGHLDIVLTSTEGKVTAQIFTASLAAKEALDLQISQLRNALIQQGVSVEKIEVAHQPSHQSFGEQHAHHDQRSSQQQRQGISQRSGYFPVEEETPAERPHYAAGSVQVDYTV
ncbi:flagellar hook-length control protein FliK [Bacillus sp. FJAT-27251]|uniref:flagellar hook-length control protein FliK n=1 Tax=Bacillus sp. FJAT-27251 TaxID=1684142 RepID=UPI0006A779DA|nr:flagellar hook-length control protein FliK [Bacillus sp. FJAT-27251]